VWVRDECGSMGVFDGELLLVVLAGIVIGKGQKERTEVS
jgi:hypothetical protein